MAQNVTSSALVALQAEIESVFTGDTPTRYPYNEPGFTTAALMENHTARLNPLLTTGGVTQAFEVHYMVAGADTITQDTTPATAQAALTCDLADGIFPVTGKQTLNHNTFIASSVSVDDDIQDSLFQRNATSADGRQRAAVLVAERFRKAIADITRRLDLRAINFLHATRTPVNNDLTLPDYLTFDAATDRFEAAAPLFQSADFLTDIDAVVANNDIMDYVMVSGRRNFFNAVTNAQFRQDNDNERYLRRFGTANIFFDIRNLDATLASAGEGYTFAVGQGTYSMWNYAIERPVPVQINEDKWIFTVRHPSLQIRQNGVLRPVILNVLYERTCGGRDAFVNPTFKHTFEISYQGGLYAAPAAGDGHTGILEMVSIPGI